MRAHLSLVFMLLLTSCFFDTSGVDSNDAAPGGDGAPGVDASPPVDGQPGVDAPPMICTPDATMCDADTLQTCNGIGTAWLDTPCDLGCDDANGPAHCDDVIPSNGIPTSALYDSPQVLSSAQSGGFVFNTDTNEITTPGGTPVNTNVTFSTINQTDGPPIRVFSMAEFELQANHTLRVVGSNALAIATSGPITINGDIDLSGGVAAACVAADQTCAGPGGNAGGAAATTALGDGGGTGGLGGGGPMGEAGGGGGGHAGMGGAGGTADANNGGAGGPVFSQDALVPLTGGGGGGGGGNEGGTLGGVGGGGGGAVQLISHVSIDISGNAPCGIGAGGAGGGSSGNGAGGGGGGAGGGILLEAPSVTLGSGCFLAANGGGGSGASNGMAGDDGALDDQQAAGGTGDTAAGGVGGGGTNLNGDVGASAAAEAGGGGGAIGVIRVNTRNGFTNDGTLSGKNSTGTLVID